MRTRVATAITLIMMLASVSAGAAEPASTMPLTAEAVEHAAAGGSPLAISVPGRDSVTIRIREHSLLAPGARFTVTGPTGSRAVPAPDVQTYEGTADSYPGSVVRLTVSAGTVSGMIATASEQLWIEPGGEVHAGAAAPPIELGDDAVKAPTSHSSNEVDLFGAGNCSIQPCEELRALVVLDGDVSFTNLGSDCFGRQMQVMNAVDGIYRLSATRIHFQVSQQNCRRTADLGTTSTSADTLLNTLGTRWANQGADRSVVFLFVGYEMPAAIVGIAWRPGVCERLEPENLDVVPQRCEYGYALGQTVGSINTLDLKTKVMAHEIGHSFNAEHETSGCSGAGTLMCPSIQSGGPATFSAGAAATIRSYAERTIGYVART